MKTTVNSYGISVSPQMYHPMLCLLADATLTSFPSDFRHSSCDILLQAVSNVFSQRSEHRLTKHSLHVPPSQDFIHSYVCLGLDPVPPVLSVQLCSVLCTTSLLISRFLPGLIIRGITPSPFIQVYVFSLISPHIALLHPPGP